MDDDILTELTFGHTPDADDAFMFDALTRGMVPCQGIRFRHVLVPIEELNRRAERGELDVTALSVHAYAFLTDRYTLLNCGACMGQGYGPRVVAREPLGLGDLARGSGRRVAVPGERTTAFLALRMAVGDFDFVVTAFDKVTDAVLRGEADAALLIHEGQLTFQEQGLHLVRDLGEWWAQETGGLPLPLGGNGVRSDLPRDVQRRVDIALRDSIRWGLEHRSESLAHAEVYARGLETERADRFVGMYVNALTIDYGETGRRAMREFLERAAAGGWIPAGTKPQFVEH